MGRFKRKANAFANRLRRWSNKKPTLIQRFVFDEVLQAWNTGIIIWLIFLL